MLTLIDLIQVQRWSRPTATLQTAMDPREVAIVLFSCALQEALLEQLLRARMRVMGFPAKARRLAFDRSRGFSGRTRLFQELAGESLFGVAKRLDSARLGAVLEVFKKAGERRNRFLHQGHEWQEPLARDCVNAIPGLLQLFVDLHNEVVAKAVRPTHHLAFRGDLLKRGFWIYVWKITSPGGGLRLYVGRTGDSSSPNAASPFERMGQHLDFRPNAKSNAMMRQLRSAGLDPTSCTFELQALGPFFPEQTTKEEHEPFRDRLARIESELARELRDRGYEVLGSHGSRMALDEELWSQVLASFDELFPRIAESPNTARTP